MATAILPFLPEIISGISGVAGGLLNQNKTDTTGPTGSALDLYNTLKNYYGQAMSNTPNFMQGYEQGGLNSIQKGTQANEQGAMNANASHGVRGAAAAYASTVPTVAGQSQTANLETSLPMVRSQYQNNIMQQALQGVQAGPKATTYQGQPAGGAFAGLANSLAGMYGMNQMSNMMGSGSGQTFPATTGFGGGPGISTATTDALPTNNGYYVSPTP
jgi:hypothetical protein